MADVWNWKTKTEDEYSSEDTPVYRGVGPIMVPVRVGLMHIFPSKSETYTYKIIRGNLFDVKGVKI